MAAFGTQMMFVTTYLNLSISCKMLLYTFFHSIICKYFFENLKWDEVCEIKNELLFFQFEYGKILYFSIKLLIKNML